MPTRKFQPIVIEFGEGRRIVFAVSPSAQDKIKRDLNVAEAKGTIAGPRERAVARNAFLAAAIEKAHEAGTRFVTVQHVKRGWHEGLSIGGDICVPSYVCLKRSVIQRAKELKGRSIIFQSLMGDFYPE